ncbi:hypothetical protein [Roseateles sp. MS654]|uniref:hypothetical protein n=1 Tax=Roseateles sp. MS654 TaxID=3412685 RepID=UPI003C2E42F4
MENSESAARAVQLREKLPFLSKAMDERLHVRPGTVFFMQYPDPLQRPRRLLQAADSDTCGLEIRSGTEAARFLSSTPKDHWHMWGTESEFGAIRSEVIRPLHDIVRASKGHWTVVDEHLPDFLEHGLCEDAAAAETDEAHQAQMADIANIRIYGLPAVSRQAAPTRSGDQPTTSMRPTTRRRSVGSEPQMTASACKPSDASRTVWPEHSIPTVVGTRAWLTRLSRRLRRRRNSDEVWQSKLSIEEPNSTLIGG